MMYQDIERMDTTFGYLQEALKKNERLLREEHIQTIAYYHSLGIAFNSLEASKFSYPVCSNELMFHTFPRNLQFASDLACYLICVAA